MPITKSAEKNLRKARKRYLINRQKKEELKALIKKFRNLVAENKLSDASQLLPLIYKKLDKAAKTNLIKKNKSSRLKSRLTILLNKKLKITT